MIDWLTILIALVIITILVGIFGFMAWKINMSDPLASTNLTGKKDDTNQLFDSVNDKRKKDRYNNDQAKKKRKESKKNKRDNKEEDQPQQHTVKFKEPSTQTSEETDNEREESEQESLITPQVVETSSKARRRHRNKTGSTTSPSASGHIEGILINKDEKSPVTTRPQHVPHPKLATMKPKDEVELAKQHQQQTKVQAKPSQPSNKQTAPAPSAPAKKPTPSSTNVHQEVQKHQEQPFTTVGGNRHKAGASSPQQQQQQQQNKSVNTPSSTPPAPAVVPQQQQAPVQVQHEQLAQRQPPRQQKETPTQFNGVNTNPLPIKQPTVATGAAPPTKLVDLVKTLPTSQVVVTELVSAVDACSLSTDELDIIMHKIANKQASINKDWARLQHGQKVDPQAHIGQVLDESARTFEEDMKNNAIKRIKELTDELNNDKRRIDDLIKETHEKDRNIQTLHVQLNALQQPQQQQLQTYQAEYTRLLDENTQLKQRLAQQQFSSLNLIPNNNDSTNAQYRVLSEHCKKLSVDNGNLENQLRNKEGLIKEVQKQKDDLLRTNQQLVQKTQENQKQFQHNEEKILKELNETRTLHINQLNEFKRRIEQLELDNEKLKREEIIHVEPTNTASSLLLDNEEREKFQQELNQLIEQNEQYKKKFDEIQIQYQSQENELRKELEQIKNTEFTAKNAQIDALQAELDDAKAKNDSISLQIDEHIRQEQNKQKQFLTELLEQDVRNQLSDDNQDFNQWLSSYQQIFKSSIESNKQTLQDELTTVKHENDQLHQNMNDIEKQLKEIEQTVQSKEEILLADLKNKDATLDNFREENEQLTNEVQRLKIELDRLHILHTEAANEARLLKVQLNERYLVNTNSPSITTDESFEIVKQPSPLPSNEVDTRAEQLQELIRSSKEALENQDSIAQQLDKHLNEIHPGGTGEVPTPNINESTVESSSSSSDQQQQQEQIQSES